MAYPQLEYFMGKLELLINLNHSPLINNHLSILYERPKLQLLYKELKEVSYMIQTLFVDHENNLHKLPQITHLKKRFKDAVQEAQDIVDLFVFAMNFGNKSLPGRSGHVLKSSLSLDDVMTSIKSIKDGIIRICNSKKMDSWVHLPKKTLSSSAAETSGTKNPVGLGKKRVLEDVVVGFDRHVEVILDKLVEDQKQLDVVSIVGMSGLGKTTLATKVFNHPFIMHYFDVRGWVTVSQTYERKDLLIQILESMGNDVKDYNHSQLHQMLSQKLMHKSYLIVIDDLWCTEAWDDLKLSFPDDHTGSRILLTSRITSVVLHAKSHGYIHQLEYLTDKESWELLCKKVFHGNDIPTSLIKPGMQIANGCGGLPLAVVLTAGVLTNVEDTIDLWKRIAENVPSYILRGHKELVENLALSIDTLPGHLRDCFLYFGGFPENYKFRVQRLIWLWVAEGFIQEDGIRSLEEIGEDFLTKLVDRSLVVVCDRKFNGAIKACSIQYLLKELCLKIATEEGFCLKIHRPILSRPFGVMTHKDRRIFTNNDFYIKNNDYNPPAPHIRSLLSFHNPSSMIYCINDDFQHYMLLMVLDLQNCQVKHFPPAISLLVHLKYLAICHPTKNLPSLICNLWSLQTLIIQTGVRSLFLPNTISNLVNLRHLWSNSIICIPSIEKPMMNLQTISNVVLGNDVESWVKCFPNIKKLKCIVWSDKENDFESLTFLETLKITKPPVLETWKLTNLVLYRRTISSQQRFEKNQDTFPASLKELTLLRCRLPWSDMILFQSLPNLEVLKIMDNAFEGPRWITGVKEFRQLKFLKLQGLNIQEWNASSFNFPCLQRLVLEECNDLKVIPFELVDMLKVEFIQVDESSSSVVKSVERIQEKQ